MFLENTFMNYFPLVRFFGNYYIIAPTIWRCLREKLALVKKTRANTFSVLSGQGVVEHLTGKMLQPGWELCKNAPYPFFIITIIIQ